MTKTRWLLAALILLALTLAALAVLGRPTVEITTTRPAPETGGALPPSAGQSRLTLAATVPITGIAALANAADETLSGVRDNPVGHKAFVGDRLDWRFARGPISVTAEDGQLVLRAGLAGSAYLTGRTNFLRGKLGQLLGKAGAAGAPVAVRADLTAALQARLQPRFAGGWGIAPNLSAGAQVRDAVLDLGGPLRLSARGLMQPQLDRALSQAVARAGARLADPSMMRDLVAPVWAGLCTVEPLGDDGLWLLSAPVAVQLAQPRIGPEGVRLAIGFDLESRALTASERPSPADCAPLPAEPSLAVLPDEGQISLDIPVLMDGDWLARRLEQAAARRTDEAARFSGIEVAMSGARLVIGGDVVIEPAGFLSPRIAGRIWVTGLPRLDRDSGTLRIEDVRLAPGSTEGLGRVKGRVADAVLAYWSGRVIWFDLTRAEDKALARARAQLDRALASLARGATVEAGVDSVQISRLAVTEAGLEATVSARGHAALRDLKLVR